jgi:uncharacterized protein
MRGLVRLLLLAALMLAPTAAFAQQFPPLTGRVIDGAGVIPPDVEARLVQKLDALETQSHRQLVVVTLPSLQGYEISDYGYRLGRAWGIGSKERNDGALLIVAPNERKLRIEVGYGLEGVLTDGMSSLIINQTIVPKFKAGDMAGGIEAGADAIIHQITLPPAEAQRIAAQADCSDESAGTPVPWLVIIIFVVLFLWIMSRARRGAGGRYIGGGGPMIWPSGGSFGGGSSGGGFGGFSGGGGSFGGGGASGSW